MGREDGGGIRDFGGRLCEWKHPSNLDRRRDADVPTFPEYRNELNLECETDGGPRALKIYPNKSWPATVYYNSWTGKNMGWKIHILNEEARIVALPLRSGASAAILHSTATFVAALALLVAALGA
ncbi:hypothetical protein FHG87_016728 [Trinorchestia longiramus]|nr:hypothetical protein FHG87_016728 [Trinorchestia longiramus]